MDQDQVDRQFRQIASQEIMAEVRDNNPQLSRVYERAVWDLQPVRRKLWSYLRGRRRP